jgi:phage shock protein C
VRERLYRSRDDRMLFGVAGGMAEWMDLDPAIVRLVWALLILAGGVGLLLYIIAAIVIPEAPYVIAPATAADGTTDATAAAGTGGAAAAVGAPQTRWEARQARRAARRSNGNAGMIFGLILVVLGAWFLIDRYIPNIDTSWFMPGALIVIGLVLVVGAMARSGHTEG